MIYNLAELKKRLHLLLLVKKKKKENFLTNLTNTAYWEPR